MTLLYCYITVLILLSCYILVYFIIRLMCLRFVNCY